MRDRFRRFAVVSAASVVTGAVVAAIAYLAAYQSLHDQYGFRRDEYATRALLNSVEEEVENHRRAVGRPPASLSDVERLKDWMRVGRLLDYWGRPVRYVVQGNRFVLYSLGRDGRDGGEGSDADVYPSSARKPFARPTLRQFARDLPTEGVRNTCLVAGLVAALMCLKASRSWSSDPPGGMEIVLNFAATAAGAIVVAFVLSALHVPNGH